MAVSESWKNQLIPNMESGLLKILIGAPFFTARHSQRRALTQFASHLGKKKKKDITSEFNTLSPIYARRLSSSSSSSSSFSSLPKSSNTSGGFLNWYLRKLQTNPVATKSISASLIYTCADITSQVITMPSDGSFDMSRVLRIFSYALLITGPCQHYWFCYLSKIMPQKNLFTILSKMIMGQVIYGPCMISIYFSYNAALRGENQYEIVARLKRDLLPTLKNSLVYWPFCDLITFMLVPVHLQPLVVSSLAYLWIVYVSYMASLDKVIAESEDEITEYACSNRANDHAI